MIPFFLVLLTIGLASHGVLGQKHSHTHHRQQNQNFNQNLNQNLNKNFNQDYQNFNLDFPISSEVDDAFLDELIMNFLSEALNDANFDVSQLNLDLSPRMSASSASPQPQTFNHDPTLLRDVQSFCSQNPQLCAELGLTDEFFTTQNQNGGNYICSKCGQYPCQCQNNERNSVCPITGESPCHCQSNERNSVCPKCGQSPCQCQNQNQDQSQSQKQDSCESNYVKTTMPSSIYDSYSMPSSIHDSYSRSYESVSAQGQDDCTQETWNPSFWSTSQRPRVQRPALNMRSSLFKDNPTVISPNFMKAMFRILKSRRGPGLLKLFQNKN